MSETEETSRLSELLILNLEFLVAPVAHISLVALLPGSRFQARLDG